MKLYFVRHGESEANILKVISNRGLKHPLTDKGRQQAETLAQQLRQTVVVSRLYSSPLLRAVQTTETVSAAVGVDFETTDALREYDCGIIEGRSDLYAWNLLYEVWRTWIVERDWVRRIEGGESFFDIRDRFAPFIESLVTQYAATGEIIVMVGHGGTYGCMLPLLVRNIGFDVLDKLDFSNTGIVIVDTTPNGLVCQSWCGQPLPPDPVK